MFKKLNNEHYSKGFKQGVVAINVFCISLILIGALSKHYAKMPFIVGTLIIIIVAQNLYMIYKLF